MASPDVREKQSTLEIDRDLAEGAPEPWEGNVTMHPLEGTQHWNEYVFSLPDQRTLLVTDLVLNIQEIPNVQTGIVLWLLGARRTFVQMWPERWFLVVDREAYAASLREILEWDFERIVMSHGEIVESDGAARLAEATAWADHGVTEFSTSS